MILLTVSVFTTAIPSVYLQGGPKMAPFFACFNLKAIIENETTSVTTQFKKLTTGNDVFIISVIV